METLEFSIFDHGAEAVEQMRSVLNRFEREQGIRIHLEVIPWQEAWTRLVQIALYGDGPAVSEIGSSWLSDMVMMNALRPFGAQEVNEFGGEASFLPASWQSVRAIQNPLNGDAFCWAIPWIADTRLIYYRKDVLSQAGQPWRQAFGNHADLVNCLQALQNSGVEIPLTMPTYKSRINLHFLASWVWGGGGDFLSQDGQQVIFNSPQALDGMEKFFRLACFLPAAARRLGDTQSDLLFLQGQAALAMSGPWLFDYPETQATLQEQFAVAMPPGVPFVGGFHLVIWKHTRQEKAALKLIEYLAGPHLPEELFPAFSFPARLDVLSHSRFADHPIYGVVSMAMRAGRSFPTTWMWGMIENRLFETLHILWERFWTEPEANFHSMLEEHISRLVERINFTLQS